jgi:hypothetical protein
MLGKGIYIYILNMPVLKIMKTTSSPLAVLTNRVLPINWLLFLKIPEN